MRTLIGLPLELAIDTELSDFEASDFVEQFRIARLAATICF